MATGSGRRIAGRWSPALVIGLLAAAVLGVTLRSVNLFDMPEQVDEVLVVAPALAALDGQRVPTNFQYPPLSNYVVAAAIAASDPLTSADLRHPPLATRVARVVAVVVATALVVLTGLLGARVAGRRWHELVGVGAATAVAVSYLAVRLGMQFKPDLLQGVWMVGSLLCVLAYLDRSRVRWLVAAGALAGLAVATKYVGGIVLVAGLVAVVVTGGGARRVAWRWSVLGASALGGVVAGTLGTVVTHPAQVLDGIARELSHQAEGSLGYEAEVNGVAFHLTASLPSSWGWPLTILAVVGGLMALVRGTTAQRLVALVAVLALIPAGSSAVRFPHYVLVALPFLAVLALHGLTALADAVGDRQVAGQRAMSRRTGAAVVLLTAVGSSLVVTVLDDLRLVRANAAGDTRAAADRVVTAIDRPFWTERYTTRQAPPEVAVFSWGTHPEVLRCDCIVGISSYQEERYRRRPDLYAEEIAVYDRLRTVGRTVAVVRPDIPLPYNWDLLPAWGLRRIPLTGTLELIGPTVTILDLRR